MFLNIPGDFGGITKQVEYTLGHELCGVVAEVGEGAKEDFKVGDRINVDPHRYSSSRPHMRIFEKLPTLLTQKCQGLLRHLPLVLAGHGQLLPAGKANQHCWDDEVQYLQAMSPKGSQNT